MALLIVTIILLTEDIMLSFRGFVVLHENFFDTLAL